jgi:hypothetical protein
MSDVISRLENALRRNPNCYTGLMIRQRAFHIKKGPSGDQEALALLYADDPIVSKYWYGHVHRHPSEPGFVACLVWTSSFVNADCPEFLFTRFHYYIKDCLNYEPCTVQHPGDAFHHASTFMEAIAGLEVIIQRFNLDDRWPPDEMDTQPVEFRLLGIYGMEGKLDPHGRMPPIPTKEPAETLEKAPESRTCSRLSVVWPLP